MNMQNSIFIYASGVLSIYWTFLFKYW